MKKKPTLDLSGALVDGWEQLWDEQWRKVEGGLTRHQSSLRSVVGVYRFTHRGHVVVIGTATGKKGGLAKRLSDFRRPSDSGRRTVAGRLVYAHRDEIVVEVLITGEDQEARIVASLLKDPMIRLHKPRWTSTYGVPKRWR